MKTATEITKEIAILERTASTVSNEKAKNALKSKIERLKKELEAAKGTPSEKKEKKARAKKQAQGASKESFAEMVKRLSEKKGYEFLKYMTEDQVKRDKDRAAKPVGWRHKGDRTSKPTKADIRNRKSTGVYYENRVNRSDVSRRVRLEKGGSTYAEGGGVNGQMRGGVFYPKDKELDWYDVRTFYISQLGEQGAKEQAKNYIKEYIKYWNEELNEEDFKIRKNPFDGTDRKGTYIVSRLMPKYKKGGSTYAGGGEIKNELDLLKAITKEFGKPPKGADIRATKKGLVEVYYYSPNSNAEKWAKKIEAKYGRGSAVLYGSGVIYVDTSQMSYGGSTYAEGGIISENELDKLKSGFTLSYLNDLLEKMFPDSFDITVFEGIVGEKADPKKMVWRKWYMEPYEFEKIKFKFSSKSEHAMEYSVYQGSENTYYHFTIYNDKNDLYTVVWGFKDRGDVPYTYVTKAVVFLHEAFGYPFKVEHTVMAKGGAIYAEAGEITVENEDERTTLSLNGIGSIVITETLPRYEFVDDISEDELENLGLYEDDFISKIEDLRINDGYKGKGYAKLLMNKALDYIDENYSYPIYLNASPMQSDGMLNLNDLTRFYEKFGFKVFKRQGNNNLMIKKSKGNTYAEGGVFEINEDGTNIPEPLYDVFSEYDEDADPYKEMERLRVKAQAVGYDFDYDLSGTPTEFWKINTYAGGGTFGKAGRSRDIRMQSSEKHEIAYQPKRKKPGLKYANGGSTYAGGGKIGIDWQYDFDEYKDEVEERVEEDIADMIEQGYTSGELYGEDPDYRGYWEVEIEEDEEDEETRNREVARLIREGYTSGFEPSWSYFANVWKEMSKGGSTYAEGGTFGKAGRSRDIRMQSSEKHEIAYQPKRKKPGLKYEDGGNMPTIKDAEYISPYDLVSIETKRGKEYKNSNNYGYEGAYSSGTNFAQGMLPFLSGAYISKKPVLRANADAEKQMKLFKEGGRLPSTAKYIKRSEIDHILLENFDGTTRKVDGKYLMNGFWLDFLGESNLIQSAKERGAFGGRSQKKKSDKTQKLAEGGRIDASKSITASEYKGVLGDVDNDGIANADDPNPTKKGDKTTVEQIELSKVLSSLIGIRSELDDVKEDAVDEIKDMAPSGSKIYARTKTPYSIINKLVDKRMINEKNPKAGLTDLVGLTIATDDYDDLISTSVDIESNDRIRILEKEDMYESPKSGYRALHYLIQIVPDKLASSKYDMVPIELQLKTKRMKAINELSHDAYKEKNLNAEAMLNATELANRADMGDRASQAKFDKMISDAESLKRSFYKNLPKMAKGGNVIWKEEYNKKYGYPKGTSHSLEEISKDTRVSMKGLQEIYNKGVGARKTNPESVRSVSDGKKRGGKSLEGKMSAEQWAMARVYSAVMGGKAADVDAKELEMAKGGSVRYDDDKIAKVMREFKMGTLRSGSGKLVTKKDQALAIALSEAKV